MAHATPNMSADDSKADVYSVRGGQSLKAFFNQRSLYKEAKFIIPYLNKLPPNFTFVDFGCGGGSITIDVARNYPFATVLGFDVDPSDVQTATNLATEAGITNARFTVGNTLDIESIASQLGFEAMRGQCDFAFEHQVLLHVINPQKMVEQMRSAIKPGGYIACRDQDPPMNAVYPSSAILDEYIRLQGILIAGKGADPQAARKLIHFALRAGFKREDIEATLGDYTISTEKERHRFARTLNRSWAEKEMVQKMLDNAGVYIDPDMVRKSWVDWANCDDGWYVMPSPQIICRKE